MGNKSTSPDLCKVLFPANFLLARKLIYFNSSQTPLLKLVMIIPTKLLLALIAASMLCCHSQQFIHPHYGIPPLTKRGPQNYVFPKYGFYDPSTEEGKERLYNIG
ncbi:hypothetical protein Y032_0008g302 [Ancylostoma ceylanicum]|uniref:Uncharacterized protein n=1 Tax=Ancylostoma ceylanicum TaxID=53326 RepID=A0A016VM31_9BILA|nr:hypothetical protein Y032_0008g302 [Ancylostoma ceylanicum]